MLRSADRKILTEQTYSAQRSYGVGRARRVARLRVRLLVTTDWTARHRRRIPRSQRTGRRHEKFRHVGYEPAVIAAEQVIDLLTLQYRQQPRSQLKLLDVEERMGATDPCRQLGQLAHLILRKASSPPPEATDDSI